MTQVAVITGGLLRNQQGWQLHPDLMPWKSALLRRRQSWFDGGVHQPLSLLAELMAVPPARLLAGKRDVGQYWVVTPWHGQAVRGRVRLLPQALLNWGAEDARWLQGVVQPLLDDLNMALLVLLGGAMVMHCATPLDVAPRSYPALEADGLSDRHPEGADGGKLMRLLSEIQMVLHQHAASECRQGKMAVHGVWLWGGWHADGSDSDVVLPRIACRDPALQSICDGRDWQWLIATPEDAVQMLASEVSLPAMVVLTGAARALLLSGRRWFPWGKESVCETASLGHVSELWQRVRATDC